MHILLHTSKAAYWAPILGLLLLLSACTPADPAANPAATAPIVSPMPTNFTPLPTGVSERSASTTEPTATSFIPANTETATATADSTIVLTPPEAVTAVYVPATALPVATTALPRQPAAAPASSVSQAVCPPWFATPVPGQAMLVVDNYTELRLNVHPAGSAANPVVMDPKPAGSDASRLVLTLSPGHYTYEFFAQDLAVTGVFDLAAGESREAALSIRHDGPNILPGRADRAFQLQQFPLQPPQGCPGANPIAPTPILCPQFPAPAAGKGLYVIENYTNYALVLYGAVGLTGEYHIVARQGAEPPRLLLDLSAGHYELDVNNGDSVGHITFDIQNGQSLVTDVALVARGKLGPMGAAPIQAPAGCAGGPPLVTPTPAPPPACPSWFHRPDPGKGLLVFENDLGGATGFVVSAQEGMTLNQMIGPKVGDEPGRLTLQLTPGHYRFSGVDGRNAPLDIQAGQMLVMAFFDSKPQPRSPVVNVLQAPPGCP